MAEQPSAATTVMYWSVTFACMSFTKSRGECGAARAADGQFLLLGRLSALSVRLRMCAGGQRAAGAPARG